MKTSLERKVLNLLLLHGEGLSTPDLLAKLRPRVSQPTLWRTLDTLLAHGALTREGKARATRYHARARTDASVLRSRRMHESVAKRLLREPALECIHLAHRAATYLRLDTRGFGPCAAVSCSTSADLPA